MGHRVSLHVMPVIASQKITKADLTYDRVGHRAGTCILNEAGGFMYSAQPPENDQHDTPLPAADLGSRLYLAIRPCSGTEQESSKQAQDRVAGEIWKRVERMDYKRPT